MGVASAEERETETERGRASRGATTSKLSLRGTESFPSSFPSFLPESWRTAGNFPILVEESIEYTPNLVQEPEDVSQHVTRGTCKHTDLNRLCPKIFPITAPNLVGYSGSLQRKWPQESW